MQVQSWVRVQEATDEYSFPHPHLLLLPPAPPKKGKKTLVQAKSLGRKVLCIVTLIIWKMFYYVYIFNELLMNFILLYAYFATVDFGKSTVFKSWFFKGKLKICFFFAKYWIKQWSETWSLLFLPFLCTEQKHTLSCLKLLFICNYMISHNSSKQWHKIYFPAYK